MNAIKIFENPQFGSIRTVAQDGEPWFVGKDVAGVLGYKNPQEAIRNHVDADDKGVSEILTPGGKQKLPIINESGLYSLILSSKLPTARAFKHWVTSEVLPSIRKTGQYKAKATTPGAEQRAKAMLLNAKTRTAKQLMSLWDKAGVKPEYQALALGDYYRDDGIKLPAVALQQQTKVTYDKTTIVEKLGILSKSGKPHAQAVGAIIAQLSIEDNEREAVPYTRHGHDGVDYQYTESVIDKVDHWIAEHNNPSSISYQGKNYAVRYV